MFVFVRVCVCVSCVVLQGCMNNVTFGNSSCGYYETICGGSGAGPGFPGRSGVHTHMTNTRITDPEVRPHANLERARIGWPTAD